MDDDARSEGRPLRLALVDDYEVVLRGVSHMFDLYRDRVVAARPRRGGRPLPRALVAHYEVRRRARPHTCDLPRHRVGVGESRPREPARPPGDSPLYRPPPQPEPGRGHTETPVANRHA